MATNISLEYPYDEKWERGYLVINGEGRCTVLLYNSTSNRTSTAYARYLLAVHLRRFLTEEEQADHIDDDKTNDVIENLQILSNSANSKKEGNRKGRSLVEMRCPVCQEHFIRRKGNSCAVPCNKNRIMCCSSQCSALLKKRVLTEHNRKEILATLFIREFKSHA